MVVDTILLLLHKSRHSRERRFLGRDVVDPGVLVVVGWHLEAVRLEEEAVTLLVVVVEAGMRLLMQLARLAPALLNRLVKFVIQKEASQKHRKIRTIRRVWRTRKGIR